MSYADLHLDAKTAIARTSIAAWNALMRADPVFGRYALSDAGRSTFLAAFTTTYGGIYRVGGKSHRVDGPTVTHANGGEEWYYRGQLHRVDTPGILGSDTLGVPSSGGPARTYSTGREEWYEYGQLHRIGGPAIIYADGGEDWYERGQLHRIGGPARIYPDGGEVWFERGVRMTRRRDPV